MVGLKGQTPVVWLVLLMLMMVFAFVAVFAWQQQIVAVKPVVKYDGEFDDGFLATKGWFGNDFAEQTDCNITNDILGWKKGLRQWQKPLLTIPIAIPLMVINAGHSSMALPFIGSVNFGLIYPLVLVPIAVIGCTNGVNMLAGFNGLEAGLSLIVFSALGLISFYQNLLWLTLLAFIIVSSLLAFLIFNRFPSRLFPGDSLTYPLGAMVACFAILGNMEKPALILFIPYIVEACLKARSKFKAETFGKPNKDNSLDMPYKRVYSLTHIAIAFLKKTKKKAYEKDIVRFLLLLELIIATLVLASYL